MLHEDAWSCVEDAAVIGTSAQRSSQARPDKSHEAVESISRALVVQRGRDRRSTSMSRKSDV